MRLGASVAFGPPRDTLTLHGKAGILEACGTCFHVGGIHDLIDMFNITQ